MKTWKGLQKDWALFKTAESGGKGELLDGDPSYVTADEPLIKNLKLNLKVVYAGGEASQITQVKQAYAQKKPILFYWYTPQWLNAELKLTEVMLPAAHARLRRGPAKTQLRVPVVRPAQGHLDEVREVGLARRQRSIKKFSWTAQDQNAVAVLIAGKKMKPDDAAKKWIAANPNKVKAWLAELNGKPAPARAPAPLFRSVLSDRERTR